MSDIFRRKAKPLQDFWEYVKEMTEMLKQAIDEMVSNM
jgi:hypothetical protein